MLCYYQSNYHAKKQTGFTIVELLIIIVIIALLAAIVVVSYSAFMNRTRNSKITADLAAIEHAIIVARTNRGDTPLRYITGSTYTAYGCDGLANGTNLATLPKAGTCWTSYTNALTAISNASGININNLTDPWGRPYMLDENEAEGSTCGGKDILQAYSYPYTGAYPWNNPVLVPFVTPGC